MKVSEVARQLVVSRRTVYQWLASYRAGGMDALRDRGSRPRCSPRRMPVPYMAFSLYLPLSIYLTAIKP